MQSVGQPLYFPLDMRIAFTSLFVIALLLVGCVERKLTVTSEPEGALVYLNNQEVGRTPLTREFTWYGDYDVQLRHDGYETLKTSKEIVAPWWQWVPFDLFAEVIPVRWKDYHTVAFTMQPASTQPISGDVMLDRATKLRDELQSSERTRGEPKTGKR